jgi:cbb3-type cytochrome oxidase cytochrome c subunit
MGNLFLSAVVVLLLLTVFVGYLLFPADGGEIFVRENCDKCHTLRGEGLGTIDLTDITQRRSRTWIREQIIDGRRHDPQSGMPRFGHLPEKDIKALTDHLEGE